MIVWENLLIKIMEQEDIEPARIMHNDPSTLLQLSDIRHISSAEQARWFESVSLASKSRRYTIRHNQTTEFIGLFRLDALDMANRSATIGLDIAMEHRGNGYAKQVYAYFLDYLFNQMGLNRLDLVTLETNDIAISLYTRLGFVQEGRLRQAIWRNGKFQDLLLFSLLQNEYKGSCNAQ